MKTSKNITVTDARTRKALNNLIKEITAPQIQKTVKKAVDNEKIKTGKVTKFYPYLDKAEVKIDKTKKKVLCKVLHRFAGGLIDFFTPLGDNSYCETLKEPCILPRDNLHACIVDINDNTKEYLLLGYYYPDDIVGFEPASIGAMKIMSFGASKENYIEFSGAGLKIQTTKEVEMETGEYNTDTVEVHHAHVEDVYSKDEIDKKMEENSVDGLVSKELLQLTEDYEQTSNDKYYLFRGDCWTINNNYESSAAITSKSKKDFTVTGTFRTHQDMVGIYWNSKDLITHPYISYGSRIDYNNVIFECDVEFNNCLFDYTSTTFNSTFTIEMNDNTIYYLKTSDYITTSNNTKHLKINFNNLIVTAGSEYKNKKGETLIAKDSFKINVSNIKFIMFVLIPPTYEKNETTYTIRSNLDYYCKFKNITVENGDICNEHVKLKPHQYRLCEGYDDFYNLNPYRVTREMRKLGYSEWVDLYIGASHFYEKSGTVGDTIDVSEFNHTRTEKMVLDKTVPLNKAFIAWLDCYSRELKANDCPNLVVSVSMENLQCPTSWRQRDSRGNYAMTGWVPSTFFYSPCHSEVLPYMQSVSRACLDIVVANNMQPILQLGEAWWWWNEYTDPTNRSPCFYDDATKNKYLNTFHNPLPVYVTPDGEYDAQAIDWLNKQIVDYSWGIRSVVKSDRYTNGLYMALFFPPSVLDSDRVPPMMQRVNYLSGIYSRNQLDILQVEDYDWVTGISEATKERDRSHHPEAYEIGEKLGFKTSQQHYFGGFVQYEKDAIEYWRLIKQAMDDAITKGFSEVFVWAGSQVRRDNKIIGYDEYEMVQHFLSDNKGTTVINMVDDEQDPPITPSGWQTFTKTSNFWNVTDNTALKYRKKGSIVELKGETALHENTEELTELLVGTLPRGFRPGSDQYYNLHGTRSSNTLDWICCVRENGDVYVIRVKQGSTYVTPATGDEFVVDESIVWFMA